MGGNNPGGVPGHGDDDHKDDKPFDGQTYLFIRDNVFDNGTTPSTPPVWLSPDIVVTPPGGTPGGNPIVGEENVVSVTVRNGGGIGAMGVWVDAFAASPTTGWTPATAEAIPGAYVDVAPYSSAVANLTWVPITGALHRCLMARCSLIIPSDTYANPAVFDVMGDRHVAQHNVNLVELAQNQMTMTFGFMIVNGGQEAGQFFLIADHIEPTPNNIRMLEAGVGCTLAQFGRTPLRNFELTIGERIDPGADDARQRERMMGVLAKPLRELTPRPTAPRPERIVQRVTLKPGEARQAFLTVARNPETRPGDLHVMEISQVNAKTRQVTGGLWIVLKH